MGSYDYKLANNAASVGDQQRLASQLLRLAPGHGRRTAPIPGLELTRVDAPTLRLTTTYQPSICLIVQGEKSIWLGDRLIKFGALDYLMSSLWLPVMAQITKAAPGSPYLAIRLAVDFGELSSLLLELPRSSEGPGRPKCGLASASGDRPIIEAFARLVALLETPEDIGVMAPLVRREIFYRVLSGKLGPSVRALVAGGGSSHRIAKVIAMLNERYREPLRIREMAEAVNLSESGLAHSFKAATRMSPVQFQKRLRLHEARRLMLSDSLGAQTAGHRVGYESPSQFSRDYRRLFGSPPAADIARLRCDMI